MKAIEILLEMQYAIDTTGTDDMIGLNEAIEEIKELQQELKQGQENYDKLWDMYSELKREKDNK